jgi:cell division protein FtsI/penicillin-binding protein 2
MKGLPWSARGILQAVVQVNQNAWIKGVFQFTGAVAHSDNSYFSTVYKRFLDQRKFPTTDSALSAFKVYATQFGLGT